MDFDTVDLEKKFYEFENEQKLIVNLYKIHRQNGGKSKIGKFYSVVPKLMTQFGSENNISLYRSVENDATQNQNWVSELAMINYDFKKYCYKLFKWNQFVPTREYADVGPNDDRKHVKFTDMLAHDIPTLDVWREQQINITSKNFRDDNKIPVWRGSIHTRHYDRGNGSLRDDSYDNQIHGYDMQYIHDASSNRRGWQPESWFGSA